ncbi:hypothetical protein [Caldicellulosiruptor sp. DIB 104C]|uniref:hypothetical protein n=1 Tax=Caldicellulosiruptor sp. DIB 104C TaxID=3019889 RepID=UPI002305B2F8|nr:hypothetical protein [Caldicellulosiruptor sp. DIB 104C]
MTNINAKKLIISFVTLFLVIIVRFCIVNDIAKGENVTQQTNTPVKKLYELKVDKKLQCYFDKNYAYIKLPQDFLKKSIDIKIRIYRKNKTTEDYYLTLYQVNNQTFRYKIDGNNVNKVEAYPLNKKIGISITEVTWLQNSVFVDVYKEPKSNISPAFIVVRGYNQNNELCYVSSMNIRNLSEGKERLDIETDTPSDLAYIEAYLEYATIKSTRVVDWACDKIERRVYITATYYEPHFENISQKKAIIDRNQMFDRYLYLKLSGYDLNGKKIALSSRNMVFDIKKLISTEGYAIDTCIAQLNLPETVVPEKWEVECFTSEKAINLLDWVLNRETGDLFIVATNFTSENKLFLAIKGYDEKQNKVFLSSRNMQIQRGIIDTAIISNIPPDVRSVKVEVVPDKADSSYIVDWCLSKNRNLYVVAVNNTAANMLYLVIEGYGDKSNKVFLTTRNMQIQSKTIDTTVISGIPSDIKDVKVKIIENKADSSYVVDWCLDKAGNLYIVTVNNTKKDMQFLVIRGYDDRNNKIFLSSRNVRLKPQTIDTSVISGVPTYLKNIQVEIVQNKSMPSFVVDWCLNKQGNLYIVGINNSERDDNLWVKIEGYDQKGQKIWVGSRNFRVRKGTIDTCIVNNIPAYVKKVNVSILPEQDGVKIQEKLFDRERRKLYIIITNYGNDKNIKIQVNGFDANGRLVYKSMYNANAKSNIVGAHTINISNSKIERVEINVK